MKLFDSHCHYNDDKFNEDRDNVIKQDMQNGVLNAVVAGYSVDSSIQAVQIAEKYKSLYAIVRNISKWYWEDWL